ncbi:unnamed protein product [Zymoseptoria tritici ST99CH_3D7]|uniref:GH64 domain-containing protein n=1 Tax=Zymoseptoria tritici (strain ST99CH_3D7) TaxID=1276538 RepID=A0A1X7S6V4_ZYMT9|nr:unnamed protein product [Zymoseptoria tritici ST99CH_3D7]
MYSSSSIPLFLLPAFVLPALSVPVQLRPASNERGVFISKANTLNATTWNGVNFAPSNVTAPSYNTTTSSGSDNATVINTTSPTSPTFPSAISTSNVTTPGSLTGDNLTVTASVSLPKSSSSSSRLYAPTILNAPKGAGAPAASSSDVASASSTRALTSGSSTASPQTSPSTSAAASFTTSTRIAPSSSGSTQGSSSLPGSVPFSTSISVPDDMETKNVTINVNIDTREASDEPELLTSSPPDESVDYKINRDNTITDIAGARARAKPARFGLNSSRVDAGTVAMGVDGTISKGVFSLQLVNKLNSNNVRAYISGLDPNGALVMLGQNGQWIYPTTGSAQPVPVQGDIAIPLGPANSTTPISLPGFISSSRVWIADGDLSFLVVATTNGPGLVEPAAVNPADPNSEVNYSFTEFSWAADYGIYVNVSYVDFVGLPLGMELTTYDNNDFRVPGVPADAAVALCNQLKAQAAKDGQPWDQLCAYDTAGDVRRVLAPPSLIADNATAFQGYFDAYVNAVWAHYAANDLIINTQSTPGNVTCRVQGDQLLCAGDNRGYAKPNAKDIFGCNDGPFAILPGDNAVHLATVPRLCAAFNRATLLIEDGNVQPSVGPECYYPASEPVKNWYADLLKKMQVEGKGYAFSYDDVEPEGGNQSGLVGSTSPKALTIIVGGA